MKRHIIRRRFPDVVKESGASDGRNERASSQTRKRGCGKGTGGKKNIVP